MSTSDKNDALFSAVASHDIPKLKRLLDDPEVDVNSVNDHGHTALVRACKFKMPEVVRCFLECSRPVDYNHINAFGWTAMHYITDAKTMTLMCNDPRIDVNTLGVANESVLFGRSANCAKALLACERFTSVDFKSPRFDTERTALEYAVLKGHVDTARVIEDYIADPVSARERFKQELGYPKYQAAELFATIVLVCDGYYEIKEN